MPNIGVFYDDDDDDVINVSDDDDVISVSDDDDVISVPDDHDVTSVPDDDDTSVPDGEQRTDYGPIVESALHSFISKGSNPDADKSSRTLGLLASNANVCPKAMFDLGLMILETKDYQLAKALLTVLTEKYHELYGVAHLELARLLSAEKQFYLAEKHYVSADWKGCAWAIPELEAMRENPEYHPHPLNKLLEEECIKEARDNMYPGKFLYADRILHRAILAGSTKALNILKNMRKKMLVLNIFN